MSDGVMTTSHQLVIIARLAEYSQFRGHMLYHEKDPWEYMRQKLLQIEEPLTALKLHLLRATRKDLVSEIKAGRMTDERYADYKGLFERLVSRGEFADLAFNLAKAGEGPSQLEAIDGILKNAKPTNLFFEERKPAAERTPSWEKLVEELTRRLQLDMLERLLKHKPVNARRKQVVLRRVRRNVSEYCAVVHIPTDPSETFTPFMLPRIEGIVAANLRFLNRFR